MVVAAKMKEVMSHWPLAFEAVICLSVHEQSTKTRGHCRASRTEFIQVSNLFIELPSEFGPFGEFVLGRSCPQLGLVQEDLIP
jgi:hypothetical protein